MRELLSNSCDALDKIRCESLTDPTKLNSGKELCIKIIPNKEARTLTIVDNGIGMTKSDLVNLGGIVRPETKAFMEELRGRSDISWFKKFGLYSSFLAAKRFSVVSKSNDDDQYIWESSADDEETFFTIAPDTGESLGRGTKIVLTIKEDQTEYLEQNKIKNIIAKFPQSIRYPIKFESPSPSSKITEKPIEPKEPKEIQNDLHASDGDFTTEAPEKLVLRKLEPVKLTEEPMILETTISKEPEGVDPTEARKKMLTSEMDAHPGRCHQTGI